MKRLVRAVAAAVILVVSQTAWTSTAVVAQTPVGELKRVDPVDAPKASCKALVDTCLADCARRGAVNQCPRNCRDKIMVDTTGQKFVVWGEFKNRGKGPDRHPSSNHKFQPCE